MREHIPFTEKKKIVKLISDKKTADKRFEIGFGFGFGGGMVWFYMYKLHIFPYSTSFRVILSEIFFTLHE